MDTFWLTFFVHGLAAGALVGLAPLIAGIRTKRNALGNIGFFLCLSGGLVYPMAPFLSIAVALIFMAIIFPIPEK